MAYLGIDTSNYTTSAALLKENGTIIQKKVALQVAEGLVGLRQNDAVFAHVKQLGFLLKDLLADNTEAISAVGVSVSPRDEAGSYMPCFLSGKMSAESIATALKIPLYTFSHQAGHIAAALFDAKSDALFDESFLSFHISGGTTQCLLVKPGNAGENPFIITTLAQSLDLNAGQLVDRVGVMLGLKFPAGPALEALASKPAERYQVKIAFKGMDCCLSGVENQCRRMLDNGENPSDIARYCIDCIASAVCHMTTLVLQKYPDKKIIYAGGVMSNGIIREYITEKFSGNTAGVCFASPAFSADNAAGIAVLCEKSHRKEHSGG